MRVSDVLTPAAAGSGMAIFPGSSSRMAGGGQGQAAAWQQQQHWPVRDLQLTSHGFLAALRHGIQQQCFTGLRVKQQQQCALLKRQLTLLLLP